jgi:hypothetical protein
MGTLSLIIFAVALPVVYLAGVTLCRYADFEKKWNLKITPWKVVFSVLFTITIVNIADIVVDKYVEKNIPHEWRENILETQNIANVSLNHEVDGFFFLIAGFISERELFHYDIVKDDATRVRGKQDASECCILKADKQQKIVRVQRVRLYENTADKKFFQNSNDKAKEFYKIYIL